MIIARLVVLGVDLIVVVALLVLVLARKRWVSHQPGSFKGAIRVVDGEVAGLRAKWKRGSTAARASRSRPQWTGVTGYSGHSAGHRRRAPVSGPPGATAAARDMADTAGEPDRPGQLISSG